MREKVGESECSIQTTEPPCPFLNHLNGALKLLKKKASCYDFRIHHFIIATYISGLC